MKTNQPNLKVLIARIVSIFFSLLSFFMLLSCGGPIADKPNSIKFTLIGETKSINEIDVGEEVHSHGDIRIFEGSLMDENHKTVGWYTGKVEVMSIAQKSGNPDQVHEDRFRTIIFEFDDGSTIVIYGLSHYPLGEIMDINDPRDAAIIGGSGIYMGAKGQVITTRIADIHYEYLFEILP